MRQLAAPGPSQLIVCLRHDGVRSLQVVASLSRQGYPEVCKLALGIDTWSLAIDTALPHD